MEESFNIFNQFASFFIFSLKLVLDVRHLAFLFISFQLPVLCVAIVLYYMAFFFFTNSDALLRVFLHLSIIQFIFFPLAPLVIDIGFLQFAAMYVLN